MRTKYRLALLLAFVLLCPGDVRAVDFVDAMRQVESVGPETFQDQWRKEPGEYLGQPEAAEKRREQREDRRRDKAESRREKREDRYRGMSRDELAPDRETGDHAIDIGRGR